MPGGSPQGSILAGFLFCITTNQLNDCVPLANRLNTTPNFDENGHPPLDISPGPNGVQPPPSPIARPDLRDVTLGDESEEEEICAGNFMIFNPRHRWYDSELSIIADQQEIENEIGVPIRWTREPLTIKIYIDDMNSIEKIIQENAISHITTGKRVLKVHSPLTEKFFEEVSKKAAAIKMQVNQAKTQLLCISASIHDVVTCYIQPQVNGEIKETVSSDELKILGFKFNGVPSVKFHVADMCSRFRAKLWSLRN